MLLIERADGNVVVKTRFWRIDFLETDIKEFLAGYHDLQTTDGLAQDTPVFVAEKHKVFHGSVDGDMLLLHLVPPFFDNKSSNARLSRLFLP